MLPTVSVSFKCSRCGKSRSCEFAIGAMIDTLHDIPAEWALTASELVCPECSPSVASEVQRIRVLAGDGNLQERLRSLIQAGVISRHSAERYRYAPKPSKPPVRMWVLAKALGYKKVSLNTALSLLRREMDREDRATRAVRPQFLLKAEGRTLGECADSICEQWAKRQSNGCD